MPLTLRALTTLAEVKVELGITDTLKDTLLEKYINTASDVVLKHIDRKLIYGSYEGEEYPGSGTTDLYIREYPIVSISQILLDECELVEADDDYTLTDVDKEEGKIYRSNGWNQNLKSFGPLTNTPYAEALRNVEIDYIAGYCTQHQVDEAVAGCAERNLPYDIEWVVTDMVSQMYRVNCTKNQGQAEYKAGKVSIKWSDLLEVHSDTLSFYERRYV